MPISLLGIALFQTAYFWHNRGGAYRSMSVSRVIRSAATSGSSVGLGFGGILSATGLILGDAIGQILGGFYLWKKQNIVLNDLQWPKVKYFARRYIHFPVFLIPAAFANKAANYLPILFIGSFSAPLAGFFTLTQRMVYASSGTVAAAFGDVFKQKAAEELRTHFSCRKTFVQTFKKLLVMVSIPYILLQFFAELLFSFVFGSEWALSGTYAQIIAPMFLLQFIVSPLSNVLIIREKQQLNLSLQLGLVLGVIAAFYYGIIANENVVLALQIFTFVNCMKYIIELLFSWKYTTIRKN
jgi:O-antigen/teichoic acid export membrane protein